MFYRNPCKDVEVSIQLKGNEKREHLALLQNNQFIRAPIYTDQDDQLAGDVLVSIKEHCVLEHKGIFIELIGRIEEKTYRSTFLFLHGKIELEKSNISKVPQKYWFVFNGFPNQPETCTGITTNIRYFLKVTIVPKRYSEIILEQDIIVHLPEERDVAHHVNGVTVGDSILVNYQQDRFSYSLNDRINARLLIQAGQKKIKELIVSLLRKETVLIPQISLKESKKEEIITEFNLSDKCPKGQEEEVITFQLPLGWYKLTPTYIFNSNDLCYILAYFIRLKLVGEDGHDSIRDVRIDLWRKR